MRKPFLAWAGLVFCGVLGCAEPAGREEASRSTSTPELDDEVPVLSTPGRRAQTPGRGRDEVRVALFVLPGDASVEVDNKPVRRRDGVIELVGKVGDKRRVRVFKGSKTTEEKVVTIQDTGTSPALVNLNEPPPPGAKVKKPRGPAVFTYKGN